MLESYGREFTILIENANMSKVYRMPVLIAFYIHGNVCMTVTEEQLLTISPSERNRSGEDIL